MSIQTLARTGVALAFAALISGCSVLDYFSGHDQTSAGSGKCAADPENCMYEGHYEPGERGYAVQKARDLNQAQLQRMRSW